MADKQTIIISVVVGTSLGAAIIGIGILSAAVIKKLLQRRREAARILTDSTPLLAEIVTPDESPVPIDKFSSSSPSVIPSPALPAVASSFVVHREEARSHKKPLSQLPTAANIFEKFPRLGEWYNSRVTPQITSADFFENYCIEFLRDYEVQYNGSLIKGATIEGIFFLLATLSPSSEAFKDLQEVFFATYTGPTSAKEVVHLFISAYFHFKKSKSAKSNILMSLDYWLTHYFHDLFVDKHKEHSSTQLKEETICILIKFLTTLKNKKDHFLKIVEDKLFAKEEVNTYPVALEWSARLEEIKALTKEQEIEEAEEEPESEGGEENEEEEGENPTLGEPEYPEGWSETDQLSSFNIMEWSALEVARQLTILEKEYFKQVKLYEFAGDRFSQRWMPKEAPNLNKLTTYFNNLGKWLSQMVLQEEDHEQRAKILEHILDVIEQLVIMNNFNSLMAIYAGLTNVAVHRLKKTWASVSEEHNGLFEMLSELLSPSKKFKNLKQALNQISKPPAITYVGLFLGDLVAIETHSPEFFDQKLLNLNKKRVVCKLLKQLQTFQKHCDYEYTKIPFVQNVLHSALDDSTSTLWTDEKAYDESIRLEPIIKQI